MLVVVVVVRLRLVDVRHRHCTDHGALLHWHWRRGCLVHALDRLESGCAAFERIHAAPDARAERSERHQHDDAEESRSEFETDRQRLHFLRNVSFRD